MTQIWKKKLWNPPAAKSMTNINSQCKVQSMRYQRGENFVYNSMVNNVWLIMASSNIGSVACTFLTSFEFHHQTWIQTSQLVIFSPLSIVQWNINWEFFIWHWRIEANIPMRKIMQMSMNLWEYWLSTCVISVVNQKRYLLLNIWNSISLAQNQAMKNFKLYISLIVDFLESAANICHFQR